MTDSILIIDNFNQRTILEELNFVRHKALKIGLQLGLPYHKIRELRDSEEPLKWIINCWLEGWIEFGPPCNWQSLVDVLRSSHVGEYALARKIHKEYIKQEGQS